MNKEIFRTFEIHHGNKKLWNFEILEDTLLTYLTIINTWNQVQNKMKRRRSKVSRDICIYDIDNSPS